MLPLKALGTILSGISPAMAVANNPGILWLECPSFRSLSPLSQGYLHSMYISLQILLPLNGTSHRTWGIFFSIFTWLYLWWPSSQIKSPWEHSWSHNNPCLIFLIDQLTGLQLIYWNTLRGTSHKIQKAKWSWFNPSHPPSAQQKPSACGRELPALKICQLLIPRLRGKKGSVQPVVLPTSYSH